MTYASCVFLNMHKIVNLCTINKAKDVSLIIITSCVSILLNGSNGIAGVACSGATSINVVSGGCGDGASGAGGGAGSGAGGTDLNAGVCHEYARKC